MSQTSSFDRFKLVQKTGQACTALAFNLRRTTEFLVALADYSIKCFDKGRTSFYSLVIFSHIDLQMFNCSSDKHKLLLPDTRQLVSWMRGHEGAISSLSVHSSGSYAISTSSDTAQLWNLDTFQRKRKLNVRQSVGIQKVSHNLSRNLSVFIKSIFICVLKRNKSLMGFERHASV